MDQIWAAELKIKIQIFEKSKFDIFVWSGSLKNWIILQVGILRIVGEVWKEGLDRQIY